MEQSETCPEDQQGLAVNQSMQTSPPRSRMHRNAAAGPGRIYLVRLDMTQRQQWQESEEGGEDEHRSGREQPSACAHYGGGNTVSNGCESRVSPEAFAYMGASDQTQRNGGDCRTDEAARRAVKQL